ncbi:MAG: hypothetical protein ACJAUP_001010 [Cellvibrionaceae bacterium]|jgi:hypothetical protein
MQCLWWISYIVDFAFGFYLYFVCFDYKPLGRQNEKIISFLCCKKESLFSLIAGLW